MDRRKGLPDARCRCGPRRSLGQDSPTAQSRRQEGRQIRALTTSRRGACFGHDVDRLPRRPRRGLGTAYPLQRLLLVFTCLGRSGVCLPRLRGRFRGGLAAGHHCRAGPYGRRSGIFRITSSASRCKAAISLRVREPGESPPPAQRELLSPSPWSGRRPPQQPGQALAAAGEADAPPTSAPRAPDIRVGRWTSPSRGPR